MSCSALNKRRSEADCSHVSLELRDGEHSLSLHSSKPSANQDDLIDTSYLCFVVIAIVAILWSAVAISILQDASVKAPAPVWRVCQIGKLNCIFAVFFEYYLELITIFVVSFSLFLWALRPQPQNEKCMQHVAYTGNVFRPVLFPGAFNSILIADSQMKQEPKFSQNGNVWHMKQAPNAVYQSRHKHLFSHSEPDAPQRPRLTLPASLSRSEGCLAAKPTHCHSPAANLSSVHHTGKHAVACFHLSGTHFYKNVSAHQAVKPARPLIV